MSCPARRMFSTRLEHSRDSTKTWGALNPVENCAVEAAGAAPYHSSNGFFCVTMVSYLVTGLRLQTGVHVLLHVEQVLKQSPPCRLTDRRISEQTVDLQCNI